MSNTPRPVHVCGGLDPQLSRETRLVTWFPIVPHLVRRRAYGASEPSTGRGSVGVQLPVLRRAVAAAVSSGGRRRAQEVSR